MFNFANFIGLAIKYNKGAIIMSEAMHLCTLQSLVKPSHLILFCLYHLFGILVYATFSIHQKQTKTNCDLLLHVFFF